MDIKSTLAGLLSFLLILNLAWAGDTAQKLHGPVTNFIQSAEIAYLPKIGDAAKKIGYLHWKGTDASVAPLVFVPGRGEVSYQWAENAYDLVQLGFKGDIYIWDPPGQGLSDRMLPAQPDVGHIEEFSEYSTNLIEFLRRVRASHGQPAQMLLAHSMGGAIAADTLERDPTLAGRLTLIAPMLDIRFGTPFVDKIVTAVMNVLGKFPILEMIAVNRGRPAPIPENIQGTSLGERLAWRQHLKDLYDAYVPGKTLHWVAQANRAVVKILKNGSKLKMPILLFAAENDTVVQMEGDVTLDKACGDNCQLIVVKGASHSIHEDDDATRASYILHLARELGLPGVANKELCEILLLSQVKTN